MTSEEQLISSAVNSWKLVIGRFTEAIASLTDEQFQRHVAPGRNRVVYLIGHLTVTHDRMFPMLGLGQRLHPELEEAYFTNPDETVADPVSPAAVRNAWNEVNGKLTAAFERLTPGEWLQKHGSVSTEDFAKDPSRNRLAVLLSRTNHTSFHAGQAILAK